MKKYKDLTKSGRNLRIANILWLILIILGIIEVTFELVFERNVTFYSRPIYLFIWFFLFSFQIYFSVIGIMSKYKEKKEKYWKRMSEGENNE